MAKLTWDAIGERFYEQGVSDVALYPVDSDGTYGTGVAWSGVSKIGEKPSGAEANAFYADNIKFLNVLSKEEFAASIEAYMYPDEFENCDGTAEIADGVSIGQQNRQTFGLVYKTLIGTDSDSNKGYKIHIIYGCLAAPTEKERSTVNDSVEINPFSWEITTTPVNVTGHKATSHLIVDSTKVSQANMKKIEDKLYGDTSSDPTFLLPDEVLALISGT